MKKSAGLIRRLEYACARAGLVAIDRRRLYDWQLAPAPVADFNRTASLPADARGYLQATNLRLIELEARYQRCPPAVTTPLLWVPGHVRDQDLLYFRGDNAYVWQRRGRNMDPLAYALTAYYIQAIDHLHVLSRLDDDDYFGNFQFEAAGRPVSRDLLDAVTEIDDRAGRNRVPI